MRIGVLGAGAWGTALAHVARSAGHEVHVWSRGGALEPLGAAQAWILAVPAQGVREALSGVKSIVTKPLPLIISAKGIEQGTGLFMNEVVGEVLPGAEALVLSGPSFAADVLKGLPTAVVIAANRLDEA